MRDVDGDDLVGEAALSLRGRVALLAADGITVLLLARDAVLGSEILRRDPHMAVVEAVPQAVHDHQICHLRVAHALSPARPGQTVYDSAHALHTAGDDGVGLAGTHC